MIRQIEEGNTEGWILKGFAPKVPKSGEFRSKMNEGE